MSNSVRTESKLNQRVRLVSLMVGILSNLPAMNHMSALHKINSVAFVFAQVRGSISRYHGLSI